MGEFLWDTIQMMVLSIVALIIVTLFVALVICLIENIFGIEIDLRRSYKVEIVEQKK